jgi:hypothetical protein
MRVRNFVRVWFRAPLKYQIVYCKLVLEIHVGSAKNLETSLKTLERSLEFENP